MKIMNEQMANKQIKSSALIVKREIQIKMRYVVPIKLEDNV